MASTFLSQYEPLDIIGNGSFGIIRKVRRKSDGLVFARKELNFERMNERDRKQIVAEVNILKDLHHEHIVRYHDRYVDREAGILYILMEYCGGGDLSSIIKQAQRQGRSIPEDTIWNYFYQILLALQYCHHPNGSARPSNGGAGLEGESKERRPQILHRDLKPDNVFLDELNLVKLGDFGLSKALSQASFANTYVGTPYYMSPELMQEKAYDTKSDIWSLGCVIYELCALKPPFHEAKTHSELSICIRNGRIPPLPRGYSQTLSTVIKTMLNLNPSMRPSAAQLLQHERIEHAGKVAEAQRMLAAIKVHKANLVTREREISSRETALIERENHLAATLAQHESQLAATRQELAIAQQQLVTSQQQIESRIQEAVAQRERELRSAIAKREEEVAQAMSRREEEIMTAIRAREQEIEEAWKRREEVIRQEVMKELEEDALRTSTEQSPVEFQDDDNEVTPVASSRFRERATPHKPRIFESPVEEIEDAVAPLIEITQKNSRTRSTMSTRIPRSPTRHPLKTPVNRHIARTQHVQMSAMKGVVLTRTGETLATPTPAELARLFDRSPKVGLGFSKVFDITCEENSPVKVRSRTASPALEDENHQPTLCKTVVPSSSSSSLSRAASVALVSKTATSSKAGSSQASGSGSMRSRRPPSRSSRRSDPEQNPLPPSASSSSSSSSSQNSLASTQKQSGLTAVKSTELERPNPPAAATIAPSTTTHHAPLYDLDDEENLPSPFLRRTTNTTAAASAATAKSTKMIRTRSSPAITSLSSVAAGGTKRRTSLFTTALVNNANANSMPQNSNVTTTTTKDARKAATIGSSHDGARKRNLR